MSHPSRLSPVPWTSLRDGDALRRRPMNCIAIADASKSTINTASSSWLPAPSLQRDRLEPPDRSAAWICLPRKLRRAMSCQRQGPSGLSAHQYRRIHTATAGGTYAATPSPESQSMASHSQTEFRFWGRGHTASQCLINSVPTVTSAPTACQRQSSRASRSHAKIPRTRLCLAFVQEPPFNSDPHTPTLITCPSSRR